MRRVLPTDRPTDVTPNGGTSRGIREDLHSSVSSGHDCEKEARGKISCSTRARNETRRDETGAYGAYARDSMQNARACGRVRVTSVAPARPIGKRKNKKGGRESYMKITYPVWLALKRPRTNNCSQLKAPHTSMPRLRDLVAYVGAQYFLSIFDILATMDYITIGIYLLSGAMSSYD